MKKRILALAAAAAVCLSLAGCTLSTPASVGKLGDVEITSGIYLLCQFQAFSQAQSAADSGMDTKDVKKFLKQTFGADSTASSAASASDSAASDSASSAAESQAAESAASSVDETAPVDGQTVSEYIAQQTLRNVQYYAAVKTRFAQLGGKLTDDEIAAADSTAQSIWDANADLYGKNGFGLDTIKEYEYALTMADDLLTLVYGPDGEQAVSDADVTDYLENDLAYGYYTSVPLYNTSTYAFADADQTTEIQNACQAVVDEYTSLHSAETAASASAVHDDFYQALLDKLPDAYAVLDNTFDAANLSVSADFFSADSLSYYGADAANILNCAVGEGTVAALGTYSYEIFVREDPLAVNTLDDVRKTALQDMKGSTLQDDLYTLGAGLESTLDTAAMKKLPAAKIRLASSSTAA